MCIPPFFVAPAKTPGSFWVFCVSHPESIVLTRAFKDNTYQRCCVDPGSHTTVSRTTSFSKRFSGTCDFCSLGGGYPVGPVFSHKYEIRAVHIVDRYPFENNSMASLSCGKDLCSGGTGMHAHVVKL